MDNTQIPITKLQKAIDSSLHALTDIRLVIWAGDYIEARSILEKLKIEYQREIERSLHLRSLVIKNERRMRRSARRQTEDSDAITEKQTQVGKRGKARKDASLAAKASGDITRGQEQLFMLGAISAVLKRLDKRIESATGKQAILPDIEAQVASQEAETSLDVVVQDDPNSGFRYVEIRKDETRWEWRAFRRPGIQLHLRNLIEALDGTQLEFWDAGSHANGEKTKPFRFRGFADRGYTEVIILDEHRVKVEFIAKENRGYREYFYAILRALAHLGAKPD